MSTASHSVIVLYNQSCFIDCKKVKSMNSLKFSNNFTVDQVAGLAFYLHSIERDERVTIEVDGEEHKPKNYLREYLESQEQPEERASDAKSEDVKSEDTESASESSDAEESSIEEGVFRIEARKRTYDDETGDRTEESVLFVEINESSLIDFVTGIKSGFRVYACGNLQYDYFVELNEEDVIVSNFHSLDKLNSEILEKVQKKIAKIKSKKVVNSIEDGDRYKKSIKIVETATRVSRELTKAHPRYKEQKQYRQRTSRRSNADDYRKKSKDESESESESEEESESEDEKTKKKSKSKKGKKSSKK